MRRGKKLQIMQATLKSLCGFACYCLEFKPTSAKPQTFKQQARKLPLSL